MYSQVVCPRNDITTFHKREKVHNARVVKVVGHTNRYFDVTFFVMGIVFLLFSIHVVLPFSDGANSCYFITVSTCATCILA